MPKLLVIALLLMAGCKNTTPLDPSIDNPIYKTVIKFNNEKTWIYDANYYKIAYPNGDVPTGGACTDVIIRVLRANGIDLQQRIHEDMLTHFNDYPHKWGLAAPDANIDHRRVPNIMKYFERMGYRQSASSNGNDYKPGDIACWQLSPGITHIGIVLNSNGDVYHNMGPQAMISELFLFNYTIIGHYRVSGL